MLACFPARPGEHYRLVASQRPQLPARRRPMKRPLFIIVVFLLLDAVVNVAVAWACALWQAEPHT